MKHFLLLLFFLYTTGSATAFGMSPNKQRRETPISVRNAIEKLRKDGKVAISKEKITFALASKVHEKLVEQSNIYENTISNQERETKREAVICTILKKILNEKQN